MPPALRRDHQLRCIAQTQESQAMSIPVQRLDGRARAALLAHFLALPSDDRRLRFGSPLSTELITQYVDRIDFAQDAAFGVHDDTLRLVGVAHLAFLGDHAELGLSVLPGHRGRGVGSALFERGAANARNRSVPQLFMHCLNENAAVVHIARKFGMRIVAEAGEADAHLELPPASPGSIASEFVTDRFALYDYTLKSHVATWKGINTALSGGSRPGG
jgi:GNAT superfamily N-acetyltransferase